MIHAHPPRGVILAAALTLLACSDTASPPGGAGGTGGSSSSTTTSSTTTSTSTTISGVGGKMELPDSFTVEGRVVDPDGNPVEGAMVMQGGHADELVLTTGPDGEYSIELHKSYEIPAVVASKIAWRSAGVQFYELPEGPVELVMYPIEKIDNTAYVYGDPGTGDMDPSTAQCGHCHEQNAKDFQQSEHRVSAQSQLLQDVYAGVASGLDQPACTAAGGVWRPGIKPGAPGTKADKCYLGGGVLPDLNAGCGGPAQQACDDPDLPPASKPGAFGACADCHAPAIAGKAGGRDLHAAQGYAYDFGIFCDVCHKVMDVDLDKPAGVGPDLRLVLQRPVEPWDSPSADFLPLYFGPLIDVPNVFMGGSYQPKFKQSVLCAGCHEQSQPALLPGGKLDPSRWPKGLPVHSTYQEWLDGPYDESDVHCQFCHMPPGPPGVTNSINVTTLENVSMTWGYARKPEDNREHVFRSALYQPEGGTRLLDTSVIASIDVALTGTKLDATVKLKSGNCGHAVPSGEPMRALLLLVKTTGVGCAAPAIGGMTVNDVGGAHARGVEGSDVSSNGVVLTWAAGAAEAKPGMVVRAVRPSGGYDDYVGIGYFANPALTPADKGLEIHTPLGQAKVVSVAAGKITLDGTLALQGGDVLYLGDDAIPAEGAASSALAGAVGYTFARVLLDAQGARQVPHYRAVDIASDNRIPSAQSQSTKHTFDVTGCTSVTVDAQVVYRPVPLVEAKLRGWQVKDYLVAKASKTIPVP